jgi:hypothetical protein
MKNPAAIDDAVVMGHLTEPRNAKLRRFGVLTDIAALNIGLDSLSVEYFQTR